MHIWQLTVFNTKSEKTAYLGELALQTNRTFSHLSHLVLTWIFSYDFKYRSCWQIKMKYIYGISKYLNWGIHIAGWVLPRKWQFQSPAGEQQQSEYTLSQNKLYHKVIDHSNAFHHSSSTTFLLCLWKIPSGSARFKMIDATQVTLNHWAKMDGESLFAPNIWSVLSFVWRIEEQTKLPPLCRRICNFSCFSETCCSLIKKFTEKYS